QRTTSRLFPKSGVVARCGTSSIRKIPIGSTSKGGIMSTPSITMPDADIRWDLPARGPVAMYGLIAAEAAIFTIFVVAYIFYIGKSVTGPQPQDVLHVPVLFTLCLLLSRVTVHCAVQLLRGGQ